MIQFEELFPDIKIVLTLTTHLSWSHLVEILPLETQETRLFYANDSAARNLGKRDLHRQISLKAYKRREIANTQLSEKSFFPFNVFDDPYLLDTLDLKENFLKFDLEKVILAEPEALNKIIHLVFIQYFCYSILYMQYAKEGQID